MRDHCSSLPLTSFSSRLLPRFQLSGTIRMPFFNTASFQFASPSLHAPVAGSIPPAVRLAVVRGMPPRWGLARRMWLVRCCKRPALVTHTFSHRDPSCAHRGVPALPVSGLSGHCPEQHLQMPLVSRSPSFFLWPCSSLTTMKLARMLVDKCTTRVYQDGSS